jgi:glycosyltransferase involved in cell wall biosynthesis
MSEYPISFVTIYHADDQHFIPDMIKSLPPDCQVILCNTVQSNEVSLSVIKSDGRFIFAQYTYVDFDYSSARNAARSLATSPVVFSIDADERLHTPHHSKILRLAQMMVIENILGIKINIISLVPGDQRYEVDVTRMCRMFLNVDDLYWEGFCHESIEHSIVKKGGVIGFSDIFIVHEGYNQSEEILEQKLRLRIKLLLRYLNLHENDYYFNYLCSESNKLYNLLIKKGVKMP